MLNSRVYLNLRNRSYLTMFAFTSPLNLNLPTLQRRHSHPLRTPLPHRMSPTATADRPLASKLAAIEASFKSKLSPEVLSTIEASSAELAKRFTPSPLPIGATVPSFELPNAKGDKVSLKSLLKDRSALVLTYYRGSWCPYCNLALRALAESLDEMKALGASLVALTPETPDETLTTKEKNELPYEVLSDDALHVADKLGVAFTVGEDVKELYASMGVVLDSKNGNDGVRKPKLPVPATFVLDGSGKVVYSFVDIDYTKRAEPSDIIDAIKAIKA